MSDSESESSGSESGSESGSGSGSGSESPAPVVTKATRKRAPKKKKTDGPKRPLSAYMFFCKKMRSVLKEENPELSFGALGKLLGQRWKEIDADDREVYTDKAAQDKVRFANEGGVTGRASRKKKARVGPKRPLSAYMFFSQAKRAEIKEENPDYGFGEMGRAIGSAWKECVGSEREKYVKMAADDKIRYKNELKEHGDKTAAAAAAAAEESSDESEAASGSGSESDSD